MEHIKTSPKDFFLYLLSNIALYYCAGWLVSLLYDYINYGFGTINAYDTSWIPSSMRWAIASLVIVFPVYIWVTHRLNRDLEENPAKRDLWVRKWLMYLTLALASVAMVVDLVALVNEFLSGEFAMTFFLKVVAVAVISGLVFGYYFYELRRDGSASSPQVGGKKLPSRSLFRWIAIILIVVTIIAGFFIVGSPTSARLRQYDARRVTDLQSLQQQIVTNYWQRKNMLPTKLADLNDSISGFTVPVDPAGAAGALYEYRIIDKTSFELCATFSFESAGGMIAGEVPMPTKPIGAYYDAYSENWAHAAGRACFTRTIDPQLYPPTSKL